MQNTLEKKKQFSLLNLIKLKIQRQEQSIYNLCVKNDLISSLVITILPFKLSNQSALPNIIDQLVECVFKSSFSSFFSLL